MSPHLANRHGFAESVVLLHGIGGTRLSMARMERALAAAGYRTLNLGYPSRRADLGRLAHGICPDVEDFAAQSQGTVHFVAYSLGALVLRVLLDRHRPAHLGRVVMIGPPNGGSRIADLLQRRRFYRVLFGPAGQQVTTEAAVSLSLRMKTVDYPVGIIAGTRAVPVVSALLLAGASDGRVTVAGTKLDGMADHVTVDCGHRGLVRNPFVLAQTLAFLRHGRFEPPGELSGKLDFKLL